MIQLFLRPWSSRSSKIPCGLSSTSSLWPSSWSTLAWDGRRWLQCWAFPADTFNGWRFWASWIGRIGIQGWPGTRLGQLILDWNVFFNWIELDKDWFLFLFFWGRPKVDFSGTPWPCRIAIKVDFIAMESIATRKTVPVLGAQWTKFGGKPSITFPCRQWWLSLSHDLSLAQKSFAAYSNTDPWSMHLFDHVWPLNSLQSHVFSSHVHTCSAWVVPGGYTIKDVQHIFYSFRPGGIFLKH